MAENPYAKYLPQTPQASPPPADGPAWGPAPKPDKPDAPKTTWRTVTGPDGKPVQVSSEGKTEGYPGSDGGTVDEKKIATLVTRIAGGFSDIQGVIRNDPSAQEPGIIETMRGGLAPGGLLGTPVRMIAGGNRRTVADAEGDVLDALLTLGTGAAYSPEQLASQKAGYFPQYTDSDEEKAVKNRRLQRLIVAAQANAGPAWVKVEPLIKQYMQGGAGGTGNKEKAPDPVNLIDPAAGVSEVPPGMMPPPGGNGPPDGGQQVVKGETKRVNDDTLNAELFTMWKAGAPFESLNGYVKEKGYGGIDRAYWAQAIEYAKKNPKWNPFGMYKDVPTTVRERLGGSGGAAYAGSVGDAFTGGRMDEIAGVGAMLTGGDYTTARDSFDAQKRAVAAEHPVLDTVGSITGGVLAAATGSGVAARFAPGATSAVTNALARIPGAAPAAGGAAYGAYYGSGQDNQDRLGGGTTGAVIGGVTGGVFGRAQNALSQRAANMSVSGSRANALAQAGDAEGITINRAIVEPKYTNKVSGVDASAIGGPRLQAGMQKVEGEFADAVGRIGGGRALDRAQLGGVVEAAGERAIENTGKIAKAKYDRAVNMAGDTKIKPAQAMQKVDEAIAKLSETPETFKAELAYLQTIKSDLSKDLSVEGLRRMRTTQRKKISNGDLVFGEDEARVLSIMDAAADDIRNGLTSAGKGNAAKAFDTADKAYRARMDYIKGTVQKVLGKRNSNMSAEGMAGKFSGMSKGDVAGLKRFQASLTPEERADVAQTFAHNMGLTGKKDFSVNAFMTATSPKNASDDALRAMLGNEGFQSVQNLRLIGQELERVTGAMNSRTSKTAVAIGWRGWLWQAALGGGAGYAGSGGDNTTALAGAALLAGGMAGGKAGREMMTAKMLLNPNITKWLRQAPRTANPRAIDAHFAKLKTIAKTSPAIADDIERFSQSIFAAANDNAGIPAAAGDGEKDQ